MITEHIDIILYVTGAVTGIVAGQFFFPKFYSEKILKIKLESEVAEFYFAHWGIVVACLAALLIMAASNEALQLPVITVVAIEKAILAAYVYARWNADWAKQMRPAALFDTACVVLYGLYLLGL